MRFKDFPRCQGLHLGRLCSKTRHFAFCVSKPAREESNRRVTPIDLKSILWCGSPSPSLSSPISSSEPLRLGHTSCSAAGKRGLQWLVLEGGFKEASALEKRTLHSYNFWGNYHCHHKHYRLEKFSVNCFLQSATGQLPR